MELQNRKNLRISGYDYSTCGAYFITICTHNRRETLSMIRRGDPCGRPLHRLTHLGQIAAKTFREIERMYPVEFDTWVIMPDHIHFIAFIPNGEAAVSIGRVVGAYKSLVSKSWLDICKARGLEMGKLWQRNYYEHVVRNDEDLMDIRAYIEGNPFRWVEKHSGN